jgi:hypothetical protein
MSWKNYFQRNESSRLGSRKGMMSLREPHKGVILQSATGEELGALLPSVLDKAFKGEL